MSSLETSKAIILDQPNKWEDWKRAFLTVAKYRDLKDYIEGKKELLQEPEIPQLPGDPRLPVHASVPAVMAVHQDPPPAHSTRSHSSRPRAVFATGIEESTTSTVESDTQIEAISAQASREAFDVYNMRMMRYRVDRELYREQQNNIAKIDAWMRETVSPSYAATTINTADSIRQAYQDLEKQVGVSTTEIQREIRLQYETIMKPNSRRNRNIESWLLSWEDVMNRGQFYKIPFAMDVPDWTDKIFDIFRTVNSEWVTAYELRVSEQIDNGSLTYREVSSAIRRAMANLKRHTPKGVGKGSFGPTFAGEQLPEHVSVDAPKDRLVENQSAERRGGQKRKHGQTKTSSQKEEVVCPACSLSHKVAECFYIFPEKAFPGWKPYKNIQKRVERLLKEDTQLAEEVARIKLPKAGVNRPNTSEN
jgi:hypothetical protein